MNDKESQQRVCPPEWKWFVPTNVERPDVKGDRETEVGNGDHDGDLVAGDKEAHQPRLEHVGREEGEKYDDEGEH